MLHYPYFMNADDDFMKAQENLVDHCLNKITPMHDKKVLDIGCGNGVLANYIMEQFNPVYLLGVDLNKDNIAIALSEKNKNSNQAIDFIVDDAQYLVNVKDNSFDIVVNIESAFHYPEKDKFLGEIFRVLKPGGRFVIADILTTGTNTSIKERWKRKMNFHHWSLHEYKKAFENSNLQMDIMEDMTENIIKGFRNDKNYFRNISNSNKAQKLAFNIFFKINIILNTYLLKNKRKYYLFVGSKV